MVGLSAFVTWPALACPVLEVWSYHWNLPLYAVFMSKLRLNTNWSIFVDMCFFVVAGKNSSYLLTILVSTAVIKNLTRSWPC